MSEDMYIPPVQSDTVISTIGEVHDMLVKNLLNPDPVGQRPSVNNAIYNSKSIGIIESIFMGAGIGILTLRDIRNQAEDHITKMYQGFDALVIDGGHRTRAIKHFIEGGFPVKINGISKYYRNLSKAEKTYFMNVKVSLTYNVCSSRSSINIFRSLNKTTQVNAYEMIMSNDQSALCEFVRKMTRSYVEYDNNEYHPIFEVSFDKNRDATANYFESVNKRAIWYTMIWIIIHKAIGRGNVDAGEKQSINLIGKEELQGFVLSKRQIEIVQRFFNDFLSFAKSTREKSLTLPIFGAFQCVWFAFIEENKGADIEIDMEIFAPLFKNARARLTGTLDQSLNKESIIFDNVSYGLKEFLRKATNAFSEAEQQKVSAKCHIDKMLELATHGLGVTFLDSKRSLTTTERGEMLDIQNGKCGVCTEKVFLEDTEWAHDVPYTHGGRSRNGVVLCKKCHADQHNPTLKEYLSLDKNKMRVIK